MAGTFSDLFEIIGHKGSESFLTSDSLGGFVIVAMTRCRSDTIRANRSSLKPT